MRCRSKSVCQNVRFDARNSPTVQDHSRFAGSLESARCGDPRRALLVLLPDANSVACQCAALSTVSGWASRPCFRESSTSKVARSLWLKRRKSSPSHRPVGAWPATVRSPVMLHARESIDSLGRGQRFGLPPSDRLNLPARHRRALACLRHDRSPVLVALAAIIPTAAIAAVVAQFADWPDKHTDRRRTGAARSHPAAWQSHGWSIAKIGSYRVRRARNYATDLA